MHNTFHTKKKTQEPWETLMGKQINKKLNTGQWHKYLSMRQKDVTGTVVKNISTYMNNSEHTPNDQLV